MVQNGYSRNAVRVLPYFTEIPNISERNSRENLILFTGRVAPQKGLDVLLRSLKHLKASFRLVVDGDGSDMGKARKLSHALGVEDRVEFVGWAPREEHLAYYRQATVVVVPSVWPEPFGMVGIEAMSYGKPVVAFNVGGIPEWLEHGVTGFLVKPYEIKEMAQRIDILLDNPAVAHEMGMRGRKRVEQDFNKDKHLSALLEIYRQVIDGRTGV
jgi:glycosyltransferase involved in cell wall biosynthesis